MDIEVPLHGEYADMRRFIHTLEIAPEFIVIRDVAAGQVERREEFGADVDAEPDHVLPEPKTVPIEIGNEREWQAGLEAADASCWWVSAPSWPRCWCSRCCR